MVIVAVIDFKTDAPPMGNVQIHNIPRTWSRCGANARILEELGVAAPAVVRAGLLFTAEHRK